MKTPVLMFDDTSISRAVKYISSGLDRELDFVFTMKTAETCLEDEKYGTLLVEPFQFYDTPDVLCDFLRHAKEKRKIQIILYSTQKEELLRSHFGLQPEKHYDRYVSKIPPNSIERLKAVIC